MRCALYARVSTLDQNPESQLAELRRYVAATEYVDHGVSGVKEHRSGPATGVELRRSHAQRHELEKPAERHVAHRHEHEASQGSKVPAQFYGRPNRPPIGWGSRPEFVHPSG